MRVFFGNKLKGDAGERIAEKFLRSKGMKIVTCNYKTKLGEIDIIALDKGVLVFVEVKYRTTCQFGRPAEAITPHKIRKINQVACQYIMQHRLFNTDARFDVIEIIEEDKEINHIENAFDSYISF